VYVGHLDIICAVKYPVCKYVTECSPWSTGHKKTTSRATKIGLRPVQSTCHYKRNTDMGIICHSCNVLLLLLLLLFSQLYALFGAKWLNEYKYKLERMYKKLVMPHFEVLSQHLIQEIHKIYQSE
jgi:hypothetical protein